MEDKVTVEDLAGVPVGFEINTNDGVEVIVADIDESGNVIGWHKEVQ